MGAGQRMDRSCCVSEQAGGQSVSRLGVKSPTDLCLTDNDGYVHSS